MQIVTDIYEHSGTLISLFGGSTVIAVAISAFLSKNLADRAIENHKSKLSQETERLKAELGRETEKFKNELSKETDSFKFQFKKRELLFNKELEAASAFMQLNRSIKPQYSHPDMGWQEACEQAAQELGQSERKIEKFIIDHGAAVASFIREDLKKCYLIASHYKFDGIETDDLVSAQAKNQAGNLLRNLDHLEARILGDIRSWEYST